MKLFDLSVDGVLSDISEALSSIDTVMNDMVNVLSQDIITQNVGTWQMVNKAVQISQTIALVIVVAYWLIGFINEITDMDWRNLSIWWYFRKIIQLILAKALIDIAPDLCITIYNFVGWALKEYGNIGTTSSIFSSIDLQGIKEMAKDMNFVDKVFSFPTGSVKLKSGSRFADAQTRMIQFLKEYDADATIFCQTISAISLSISLSTQD